MTKGNQPAFPHTKVEVFLPNDRGLDEYTKKMGMDLRTYIATHALQGLCASDTVMEDEEVAAWAVAYADALLAELEK